MDGCLIIKRIKEWGTDRKRGQRKETDGVMERGRVGVRPDAPGSGWRIMR